MTAPIRRTIEFIYSASIAYVLEFGDLFIRVYYDDEYITSVTTPYLAEHLFELQYRQIGDVMRIVHPKYPRYKLSRTTATTFTLTEIEPTDGPFMTRNDLLDPLETSPTTMTCSATTPDTYGTLTASANVFSQYHVGALFQLTHARQTQSVSASGTTSSSAIDIKGSFRFITRGTWTGTVLVQRNENQVGWETFRTYVGSSGAEQNVQWTLKEESNNVQYRIYSAAASAAFRGELSSEEQFHSGVVRVIAYASPTAVAIKVVSRVELTTATRRWSEGSWSEFRGYPASLTFFEDRCIYAGALSASDASGNQGIDNYPSLRNLSII